MNSILHIVCLMPFIILSGIHLIQCLRQEDDKADKTKVFIIPSLLLYYLLAHIFAGTPLYWQLALALVFSTEGDHFLIKEKDSYRVTWGMISFTLAQVCFSLYAITQLCSTGFPEPTSLVVSIISIFVIIYIGMIIFLYNDTAQYRIIFPLYCLAICAMSCLFWLLYCATPSTQTLLMALGSVAFIISDTILSFKLFKNKNLPWMRCTIMCTYIVAEFLIIFANVISF